MKGHRNGEQYSLSHLGENFDCFRGVHFKRSQCRNPREANVRLGHNVEVREVHHTEQSYGTCQKALYTSLSPTKRYTNITGFSCFHGQTRNPEQCRCLLPPLRRPQSAGQSSRCPSQSIHGSGDAPQRRSKFHVSPQQRRVS